MHQTVHRKTFALGLTLALLLGGCAKSDDLPPETDTASVPTPTASASSAPTPKSTAAATPTAASPSSAPAFLNPLTGLEIDEAHANARPVAIMLNNLKNALPQQGQSEADIIYEVLVEGGITRMLALYQNPDAVPMIGSVRSARTYYLELALGHDAVYIHAGGSPDAYNKIKTWKVTALDGIGGTYGNSLLWRDEWRRKNLGSVHSVVTTGDAISRLFPTYSFRQEHEEGYQYDMRFDDEGSAATGETANTVTVPFSNYKTGLFEYDDDSNTYLVSEYGKPYVDKNNDQQVAVTNVLVLKTACSAIKGDDKGRITVDLSSGGKGYYACGGKVIPIVWKKKFPDGQLSYFCEDKSTPLTLQRGKSYVNIVPLNADVSFQ